MKRIFILLLSIIAVFFTTAQTNYEKFKKISAEGDSNEIKILLNNWEKITPVDPEFYTAAFNYYFSSGKTEVISVDKIQSGKEGFQLTDSTGAAAGYMNSAGVYDPAKVEKAFFYINKGIEQFPNRLDIRFGKCYVLGELKKYSEYTEGIIATVEYGHTIENNWLWTENKKLEDPERFMLDAIQTYLRQLYNTEDDNLLENMKRIGDVVIKYHPKSIEILSTTAVAYMLTKDYDKAIGYLKQAEQVDPKDFIVLNNIAQGYKQKGDKVNAVKYYELTEKYGDERAKQNARKEISLLKK